MGPKVLGNQKKLKAKKKKIAHSMGETILQEAQHVLQYI